MVKVPIDIKFLKVVWSVSCLYILRWLLNVIDNECNWKDRDRTDTDLQPRLDFNVEWKLKENW